MPSSDYVEMDYETKATLAEEFDVVNNLARTLLI